MNNQWERKKKEKAVNHQSEWKLKLKILKQKTDKATIQAYHKPTTTTTAKNIVVLERVDEETQIITKNTTDKTTIQVCIKPIRKPLEQEINH